MKLYTATIPGEALKVRSKDSYYASQKRLFVLLVIAISLAPLLVISWTSSHFYQQSWQKQTSVSLASMADSRKEIIDLFLKGQENTLTGLIELYPLADLGRTQTLETIFNAINHSGVIVDLGVIEQSGRHLSYVGPYRKQLLDKNYAGSPWFQELMKNGRYVSDVFEGFRGIPHFVVAVASPDKSWLLRATINSGLFNALLAGTEVGPGGDAFIINTKGELQTPSRLGITSLPTGEFKAIAGNDNRNIQTYRDALYATTWVKKGEWLLVLKTDIHSSLAEFYRARNRDFLIIAAATLTILMVATLLVRSMVDQIEKADSQRINLTNRIRQAEKMALVGRLAAGVAHEINNPLQIIGDQAGWISELLDEPPDRQERNIEEYRQAVAKVQKQVKRASVITHRLLGFSRKESGTALFETNQLLEESLALLESEAKKHHIILRKNLGPEVGILRSDASQLQQVFLNILNNAIEAIGEDGVITVTSKRLADQVNIEFADNGPGLTEYALGKIFDPFFTTKEKDKGTGLGLSISYNIMQRLGGEIRARNGRTGGCIFTLRIPAGQSTQVES